MGSGTVVEQTGVQQGQQQMGDDQAPPPGQRGICCTLTPWKAALLGPYIDFLGLATLMPILSFFLQDIEADQIWVGIILSSRAYLSCIGSYIYFATTHVYVT